VTAVDENKPKLILGIVPTVGGHRFLRPAKDERYPPWEEVLHPMMIHVRVSTVRNPGDMVHVNIGIPSIGALSDRLARGFTLRGRTAGAATWN
jgi:hypothetical protein